MNRSYASAETSKLIATEPTGSARQREQPSPTYPPGRTPGRDGEERARRVLDVLVQGVARPEPALQHGELGVRVALEADEEEAGVELAGGRVDAVGVVVAAPQDAHAGVRDVRAPRGCGRRPGSRACRRAGGRRGRPGRARPARRAARRRACSGRSCPAGRRAPSVPLLDQHADAARDDVRAAVHPRLRLVAADPHVPAHLGGVGGVEVVRAVLEPLQVARRRLRPATSPPPGRSRAASSASPPRRGRSGPGRARRGTRPGDRRRRPARTGRRRSSPATSRSPGSGPSGVSGRGPADGEAEPVVPVLQEDAGPSPKVSVSRAGGQADGLAGVGRGGVGRAGRRPDRPAGGHERRRVRPGAQQVAQLGGAS